MIKIGVTGNIGSGKTTLTKYFENYKSYIFNADKEAKKHLRNHSVLQKKIINIFGNQIVTKNNIDFKKLAEIKLHSAFTELHNNIKNDRDKLNLLNSFFIIYLFS